MNVAMLSFRLPGTGSKRGGVERVAHDLAEGLVRKGHQVTVWSADPAPAGASYTVQPLPFRRLIRSWLGYRLVSGYLGNLLALLPRYTDAEVMIAHGDSLLLPLRGVPVLRIMHGSALDEVRTAGSWLRKILQFGVYWQERLTIRTQFCVAISANTQRRYPAIRDVIPNGVDLNRFFPAPSEKSSQPSILFVGTLGGRKRGSLLLEWFIRTIRPARPDAVLWMVTEPGRPAEGVTYFPGIADDGLAALYRRAWVFASPSVYEGFGLPYLEAMASGTAVVATANPGSREVSVGALIERDEDFAPAVLEMLARPRCVEEGLARSRELSLERMVDRYEAALTARRGAVTR
jgi:glycosyltransferase involved in cell wall biosynthesis